LRVLQEKEVTRIGGTKHRRLDLKIIAATNRDLGRLVKDGAFREDLYYRLNVIDMAVPPLRERRDDTLFLIRHFTEKFSRELGRTPPIFSDDTLQVMKNYHWPGNVRELENLIQRLVVIVDSPIIHMADMPPHMRYHVEPQNAAFRSLEEMEVDYIRNVLRSVGGNKTRASEILGIDRKTLRGKLQMAETTDAADAGRFTPVGKNAPAI